MRKLLTFFVVLGLLFACKKEMVEKPKRLIEKEKMVSILYDISLLDAIKVHNSGKLDSFKNNSNEYIYKKHKIDSVQFAQSNIYYAADYKNYVKLIEQVKARLDQEKIYFDSIVKIQKKKDSLQVIVKKKLQLKKKKDSIAKVKRDLKLKKETDSIKKSKKKKVVL